jgi:hypothetical protein
MTQYERYELKCVSVRRARGRGTGQTQNGEWSFKMALELKKRQKIGAEETATQKGR